MFELAILAALVAAVVIAIRFNKPVKLENPSIIHLPGRYHITLAPQLGFSREFLETLALRLAETSQPDGDVPTRYFQVHHDNPAKQSGDFYLLAVAYRKGIYFLQAIAPLPLLHDADSHLNTLRIFSDAVLLHYPLAFRLILENAVEVRSCFDTPCFPRYGASRPLGTNGPRHSARTGFKCRI